MKKFSFRHPTKPALIKPPRQIGTVGGKPSTRAKEPIRLLPMPPADLLKKKDIFAVLTIGTDGKIQVYRHPNGKEIADQTGADEYKTEAIVDVASIVLIAYKEGDEYDLGGWVQTSSGSRMYT